MSYHGIDEGNKELCVIREVSEDEVIYILYERDVTPNTGYNISRILNCFKSEDEAIKASSDLYRKGYSSIIINPQYQIYTYIATFYTVIFENIYSSEPSNIDIKSYICCPPNLEIEDTTTINEFVGVSKQDNKIMVKMFDISNTRMNRDEIISEAKELRKKFLTKTFDIK